ncbi:hypothetical protein N7462_009085 [Penicillium macrosclerotiorum]|uniref:uncharacterized protein n=1 Tax=Penicillium macrosclerotiorum TaxID=303699 RepID=UPI0025476CEB|nr:uncharacterized protein N7462_009085 [Penicillium macrosclerotiorum]KAJ5676188.1 hypothetical protein N7462_009085 [Penicillium macrosclerotiorum]
MAGTHERVASNSHTRSFTGCATCRGRHVKCDEGRPACAMCTYFGLECDGYKKDIFFNSQNPCKRLRFRRPLLTEDERQRMSQWLVSTAPPQDTLQILSRIDEECEISSLSEPLQISLGPFGVFRSHQRQNLQINVPADSIPTLPIDDSERTTALSPPQDEISIDDAFDSTSSFSQLSPGFMQSLLEPLSQGPTPNSSDLLDLIIDQGHLNDASLESSQGFQFSELFPDISLHSSTSPNSITSAPSTIQSVPQDAVFLLKYYSSNVLSLMTSVRHKKTPWHVLFIPHTKDCLAALALGEQLSHASLCTFFGTLAISAFSLGGVSRSQSWLDKGRLYLRKAQKYAEQMLMTAYSIPKAAKYKTTLMAILTMIQISTFIGNRDHAEGFFLEAEKFIRVRGLKRKKSRKVRLLHHCYVFERMFHESIFICGTNSYQRQHVRLAIESSGLAPASVDGLSFRLYKWKNLSQEMLRVRDQEEGENDLHLERPGLFSASLYVEIFGIPEPWLLLLSLVIRLGTEKDITEQQPASNGLNLKDFISRSKALEDYINHIQRPSQATFPLAHHHSSIDQHILENMLEAMRLALAIYFYRRIYDLNASMLQEKVVGVRDCLLQCEYADSSVVHGSAGFIWPAFIAACEAEDPDVKESFSTWFEASADRSGLSGFTQTLNLIRKIWSEKRSNDGNSLTWLELMKKALPVLQQDHLIQLEAFEQ